MIRLPIRRCPNCGYVGPTRKFAAGGGERTDGSRSSSDRRSGGDARYACPRCGHEVEAPDPRLA